MKEPKVGYREYNRSMKPRMLPLQSVIIQNIGSTVGMSLKVAMTDLESDHNME